MKKIMKAIRNIVGKYRPESVILLEWQPGDGSGAVHRDLVILKDTAKPPPERRAEVEGLIAECGASLDPVVYTREEVHYLYSITDPFIRRVMEEGRLLYTKKAAHVWAGLAREEFESAAILQDRAKYGAVCYHCLQAVEKGLRAMILSRPKGVDGTTDMVELYDRAGALGVKTGISVEDVVYLNSFGNHRPPVEEALLPHFAPTREDAERALDAARRLVEKLDSSGKMYEKIP